MEKEQAGWLQEEEKLQETLHAIRHLLKRRMGQETSYEEAMAALREEMQEEGTITLGAFHGVESFAQLAALSQMTRSIADMQSEGELRRQSLAALGRMLDTPYFARIDFRFPEGDQEAVYIGRAMVMDEDSLTIHVYDWRSPIASLFYNYGVGPGEYTAPEGKIAGEITLKRQYEIQKGELQYFFDADTQVFDEYLRQLLARPGALAMKGIVESIQKDQDRIIRDMESDVLMVQGAAGSGKTSVALHRVAYLMYQGLNEKQLSPDEILVIAPNSVFEQYISRVLPDLGERQVVTMLFEELIASLLSEGQEALGDKTLQTRGEYVENRMRAAADKKFSPAASFKKSAEFVAFLDRIVEAIPEKFLPFSDVCYNDKTIATGDALRREIKEPRAHVPLAARLAMVERKLWDDIRALRPERMKKLIEIAKESPDHITEVPIYARMLSIEESKPLLCQIRSFTHVECYDVYHSALADTAFFNEAVSGLVPDDEREPLRNEMLAALQGAWIAYDDGLALAYIMAKVYGRGEYRHIRQVVIDEAQDMAPLHAALLALLFPKARFTIVGDVHQSLTGEVSTSIYTTIERILGREKNQLVNLNKSFRSTREIWAFATWFLPPDTDTTCFSRHGDVPVIQEEETERAAIAALKSQIEACKAAGDATIAVICKTQEDAEELYRTIGREMTLRLIGRDDMKQLQGVFITSLYMAKGLEFDGVLLWNVDKAHYSAEEDKGLLYVGCTRALHHLHLFCYGEPSPLLKDSIGRREGTI